MPTEILSVKNLTKQFQTDKMSAGIRDVTFDLHQGEVLCLVGPSGSGKTTLLRCLADMESTDSGSMTFLGDQPLHNHTKATIQSQQKDITMVFQDFNLWPHLSVLENIILAPTTSHGISRKDSEAYADELLKKFNLYDKRSAFPHALSGGQRQRVAIIRALATKPKLLLLDEITSALDPELVASVLEAIKILAQDGQSMIIATHHMKFATEVGNRILFLENGLLMQDSSTHDFVYAQKNERIKDFVGSL